MTTTDDSLDMTLMGAADHLSWLLAEAERIDATPADIAHILAGVRDIKAQAGEVYAQVEQLLLSVMGEKRLEVEGLGVVESKRKTSRKEWDNDGLWRVIVARALDERRLDEESGEYEPAHEAVARVLGECARPSWRVTPLRARGVQIDEWCIEEEDGWGIQLPPRKVEG